MNNNSNEKESSEAEKIEIVMVKENGIISEAYSNVDADITIITIDDDDGESVKQKLSETRNQSVDGFKKLKWNRIDARDFEGAESIPLI